MNRYFFATFAGLALTAFPLRVSACTCEIFGNGTPKSTLDHAKAVFVGEVLEVRPATTAEREDLRGPFIVRMRVERYWKGVKSREIEVQTDQTGCGPYFRAGQRFLVYGIRKRLSTACSGTRPIEDAQKDLQELGPGKEIKEK